MFSGAHSANHAVGVLGDVGFGFVVAFIAGEYFAAAGEAEPARGFTVVFAFSWNGLGGSLLCIWADIPLLGSSVPAT